MNFFYIILISIIFVAMYFYPNHLPEIAFAVILAIVCHHAFPLLEESSSSNWLQRAKGKLCKYKAKITLYTYFLREYLEGYQRMLIDTAIGKAISSVEPDRDIGFKQLSQLGAVEGDYAYEKLLKILKEGSDKSQEKRIVETLCKIVNDMKKMNRW